MFVNPKTASSHRTVALTSVAIEALEDHSENWLERRDLLGEKWRGTDVVFVSNLGTPLDPTGIAKRLAAVLAEAGLPRIRVYDLRHTAATLALQQGG